jgi:hypothetical protein
MEGHALTITTNMKTKHQENLDKIHLEKEKLFEKFRHDETVSLFFLLV